MLRWSRQACLWTVPLTFVIGAASVHDLAMRPAGSATLALLIAAGWLAASVAWLGLRRLDVEYQAASGGTAFLLRRAHVRSGFIALGWEALFAVMGWGQFTLLGRSRGDVYAGFAAGAEIGLCILFPAALFTVAATHAAVKAIKAGLPPTRPVPPWEEPRSEGWVMAHWHGRYHLPRAFWLHGLGLNLAIAVMSAAAGLMAERVDVRVSAIVCLLLLVLYPLVLVWQWVGIWRSAGAYRDYYHRTGAMIGSRVFVLVAAALVIRFYVGSAHGQAQELDAILRDDPEWIPFRAELQPGGTELLVRGNLQSGCHVRFARVLQDAPQVRTVLIDSPGGRLAEGERMATLIRDRGVDTRAVGECDSAATVVFLAGRHRSVQPGAHLGFHAPSAPEASLLLEIAMHFQLDLDMRAAGVSEAFVRHTLRTSPDGMWYPSIPEMLAAGVINAR